MTHTSTFIDDTKAPNGACLLTSLFAAQARLNNYVFSNKHITDHQGNVLTMQTLIDDALKGLEDPDNATARSISVEWQRRYLTMLQKEGIEVAELLPEKWWSNRTTDIAEIQGEIIDMLHFWISLALASGMNAATTHRKYMEKNEVNLNRIDTGYVERMKDTAQPNS